MLQFVHNFATRGCSSVGRGNITNCLQLARLFTKKLQIIYGKFIYRAKIYKIKQKNLQFVHKCKNGARKVIAFARAPTFTQNLQIIYNYRKYKCHINNRANPYGEGRRGMFYLFVNLRIIFFQRGTRTTPRRRRYALWIFSPRRNTPVTM